jgi:nucleoside-diphosphate-sugar epimerase
MDQSPHLFCFGYGYSAEYIAQNLLKKGWQVSGTTRDRQKRLMMREHGIKALYFDNVQPLEDPAYILKDVTHLLLSIPPNDEGDAVFIHHAIDITKMPNLKWIGYLSSTGVYGDRDGAIVDEESELRPSSRRGSRRQKAEEQWLSLFYDFDLPVHIFRLAGIYGPERSALDSVRAGIARRIFKENQAFSRIHVCDIVSVINASINHPAAGEIFNVADDLPSPSHEVIAFACQLLGKEPPPLIPFEEVDLAPMARSFYLDNNRVSNQKIKDMLDVELKYPTYKEGLMAELEDDKKQN